MDVREWLACLTVLERSKAMGIGPTWSALVQVTTRVALDYAVGVGSRAVQGHGRGQL